jgi:(p)ppGpp synthase/HD superfamily hydrolase
MNIDIVLQAISYAVRAHQGQFRKDGDTPYAAHPVRVLTIASQLFGISDPETLAAAALHDTIEDTLVDRDDLIEQFGPRVAEFVAILSKEKRLPHDQREEQYLNGLVEGPIEVKLLKMADLYDNLSDSSGLPAALRLKKIEKANQLLEICSQDFPDQWRHVLDALREQVQLVRQTVDP